MSRSNWPLTELFYKSDALHDPRAKENRAFRSMRLGRAFLSQNDLRLAVRAFLPLHVSPTQAFLLPVVALHEELRP